MQAYPAVELLSKAIKQSGSTDPVKVARAMEGMEVDSLSGGKATMRASDHQLQQPLYVATWSKTNGTTVQIDQEGTGFGWRTDQVVPAAEAELPTTCSMKRPS
jgi:branched-chain amino acid transport system substrate-binding protein